MAEINPITEALMSAMHHSPEPMVLTGSHLPDYPMIAVNDAFATLTGYRVEEAVGRNCRFLQGPETDPAAPRRMGRCLAEQRGCIEWVVNYRRDGTMFWNLLFLSPVFDQNGQLLHFFGNQRNITVGHPDDLPEYTLGKADMTTRGRQEFDAILREISQDATGPQISGRLIAAVQRINEVTTRLSPAA